jgi:hypothetical protein
MFTPKNDSYFVLSLDSKHGSTQDTIMTDKSSSDMSLLNNSTLLSLNIEERERSVSSLRSERSQSLTDQSLYLIVNSLATKHNWKPEMVDKILLVLSENRIRTLHDLQGLKWWGWEQMNQIPRKIRSLLFCKACSLTEDLKSRKRPLQLF